MKLVIILFYSPHWMGVINIFHFTLLFGLCHQIQWKASKKLMCTPCSRCSFRYFQQYCKYYYINEEIILFAIVMIVNFAMDYYSLRLNNAFLVEWPSRWTIRIFIISLCSSTKASIIKEVGDTQNSLEFDSPVFR